jgi:hypothetical protein
LAYTGFNAGPGVGIALALIGGGLALLALSFKRRVW